MWIILTPKIAENVRGNYGDYHSLMPILLVNGNYALPTEALDCDAFTSVYDILRQCETSDNVTFEEDINETD